MPWEEVQEGSTKTVRPINTGYGPASNLSVDRVPNATDQLRQALACLQNISQQMDQFADRHYQDPPECVANDAPISADPGLVQLSVMILVKAEKIRDDLQTINRRIG